MQKQATYKVLDYTPFGMQMPARSFTGASGYKFGFNGMEKDNEINGRGNSYTTFWRGYDPRIARWKSIDPITHPHQSSYVAFDNNPIFYKDPKGSKSQKGNALNNKTKKEQARYTRKFNSKVVDIIQKKIEKIANPTKTDVNNIANKIEDKYNNKEWFRFGLKKGYSKNNTTGEKTEAKDVHLRDNLYTTIFNSGIDHYVNGISKNNAEGNIYSLPSNGTIGQTTITDDKFNQGTTVINVDAKIYADKVEVFNIAKDGSKNLIKGKAYIGSDGFGATKPAITIQNSDITNRQIQVVITSINTNVTPDGTNVSVAKVQVTTKILDPQPIYNITKTELLTNKK